ncbi:hypothetical protein E2C01_067605 [Portunus trituberculatus]|uniref:Uncharacterized protein n=1 Tax=Portunus trituberculatus TaxID=210409 RepID=A0A5B7HPS3_PORTR|nr:hypothetical protein [Portunus trituberculatus]
MNKENGRRGRERSGIILSGSGVEGRDEERDGERDGEGNVEMGRVTRDGEGEGYEGRPRSGTGKGKVQQCSDKTSLVIALRRVSQASHDN